MLWVLVNNLYSRNILMMLNLKKKFKPLIRKLLQGFLFPKIKEISVEIVNSLAIW